MILNISSYALGFDGLPYFYKDNSKLIKEAAQSFVEHTNWNSKHAKPYVIKASSSLLILGAGVFGGIESSVTDSTTEIFLESAYFRKEKTN